MSDLLSASGKTYAGLFLTTMATLMYELLLVRIFSVTMYYHFAFVAISIAMFGMTCGAVLVYLLPNLFSPQKVKSCLADASTGLGITIVISLFTHLAIPFSTELNLVTIYGVALTYLMLSVPFLLSGIVVSLALTKFPLRVSSLYAVDLAGAAFGCICLVLILMIADGPSAVVLTGALAGVGAIFFSWDARHTKIRRIAVMGVVIMAGFAALNIHMTQNGRPLLRLVWVKGAFEPVPLYTKWNSFSRISVSEPGEAPERPFAWGMSSAYRGQDNTKQLTMQIDAAGATVMTEFKGNPDELDYLRYDVTNFAHHLIHGGKILVVGAGGGRDILAALCFRQKSVLGVEINQDILDAVNNKFGAFTGHLDRVPGVSFINDDARSYAARSPERFDLIHVSLIDSWAATSAGAFVLSENSLYTVESWRLFLQRLSSKGVLTFSRWYFPDNPTEIYRLTSLATASLLAQGCNNPRDHIFLIGATTAREERNAPRGVATILVFKDSLTESDINSAEETARRLNFEILVSPKACADRTFFQITSANDTHQFTKTFPVNIEAPTDDAPFFFNMLRAKDMFNPLYWKGAAVTSIGTLAFNTRAVAILGILIFVVVFLTAICILGPLLLATEKNVLSGAIPFMFFFSAIGFGFMMIEVSQMQRLIIFLGHPTYGLSVILFSLLLSSGIGSYLTNQVDPYERPLYPAILMSTLLLTLALFGAVTPSISEFLEASSTPVRVSAAVAVLFPMGIFMGTAFPIGMKCSCQRTPVLAPWLWGINGATSVVASVLAAAISLAWGISTVFWIGVFCYVLAAVALFRIIVAEDRQAVGKP